MKVLFKMGVAAIVASVGGCASTAASKGAPAMLTAPSAQTTAELQEIVSKALHGADVTIAPDVLLTDTTLFIERPEHRAPNGMIMDGRRMDKPDHFALSLSGSRCILTHEETGIHYILKTAKCKTTG